LPIATSYFPDFGHFPESSWCHALGNAGFHLISRPLPSTLFGKVPRWHLVTASLPLGLLSFFAFEPQSRALCYSNANITRDDQAE
jgi:hypothetical protein